MWHSLLRIHVQMFSNRDAISPKRCVVGIGSLCCVVGWRRRIHCLHDFLSTLTDREYPASSRQSRWVITAPL
jgi:hypothetical protein